MKTIAVSACLCGVSCRWHGRKQYNRKAIRELGEKGVRIVPVCPEVLGGLGTPRPPVRRIKGRVFETDPETRTDIGKERTAEFRAGTEAALRIAQAEGAKHAYLCKFSPS